MPIRVTRFLSPYLAAVFAIISFVAPLSAADCGPTLSAHAFGGTATRAEITERALPGGLVFRLDPYEAGWLIWVGDPAKPEENFAAAVTPPFHGPNPLIIEGWHFRNADNTGPNQPGPKNVNVPQEGRPFRFVLDGQNFDRAMAALAILLWSGGKSAQEIAIARNDYEALETATGQLDVMDLDLGNLAPGARAWIERMAFSVQLCLPRSN